MRGTRRQQVSSSLRRRAPWKGHAGRVCIRERESRSPRKQQSLQQTLTFSLVCPFSGGTRSSTIVATYNATAARPLKAWVERGVRADVILVQELHLRGDDVHDIQRWSVARGWFAIAAEAFAGTGCGTTGEVGILVRRAHVASQTQPSPWSAALTVPMCRSRVGRALLVLLFTFPPADE